MWVNIDITESTKLAQRILDTAQQAYNNRDTLLAKHCTDWVDKIFKRAIGRSVYECHTVFSSVRKQWGKYYPKNWYLPPEKIWMIKPWDYLMLMIGDGKRLHTHWVIVTEVNQSAWTVTTLSYPNRSHGDNSPHFVTYKLTWKPKLRVMQIKRP
jgi:hypothetical protein